MAPTWAGPGLFVFLEKNNFKPKGFHHFGGKLKFSKKTSQCQKTFKAGGTLWSEIVATIQ